MFTIINKLEDYHIEQLMDLYKQCWWAKDRKIEDVRKMLKVSIIIGITNNKNDLIAFTRVLTDGVFKDLVLDVVVDEKYRNQKLGEQLLKTVVTHPLLKDVRHLDLNCTEEMIPFYQKYGFTEKFDNLYFMRKSNV